MSMNAGMSHNNLEMRSGNISIQNNGMSHGTNNSGTSNSSNSFQNSGMSHGTHSNSNRSFQNSGMIHDSNSSATSNSSNSFLNSGMSYGTNISGMNYINNNMINPLMMNNNGNMMSSYNQKSMMNRMNLNFNRQSLNTGSRSSTNQTSNNNPNIINVLFRVSDEANQNNYTIHCNLSDKVSDIIKKYRKKASDSDPTKQFIFNGQKLKRDLTANEQGLTNQAIILVITARNVKGA